jgi:L-threonylcarbamoyladenylate synthase
LSVATVVAPTPDNLARAAEILRASGVVAIPTETVYGLAGMTRSLDAVRTIHRLKGRPADNPMIAHVLDARAARRVCAHWNEQCDLLANHFWPGPLTLIMPRAADVPAEAAGGRDTIAVRAPSHPVARRVLELVDAPLSAPSANMSGRTSATTAQHVAEDFRHVADLLILDGGPCAVGIESTVVDMCGGTPVVLRPGCIDALQLSEVLGRPVQIRQSSTQGASPGTASSHYAPSTPATLVARGELASVLGAQQQRCAVLAVDAQSLDASLRQRHQVLSMPAQCESYAAVLYDRLRVADASGCELILVQNPATPPLEQWAGVLDRLRRATHR